MKGMIVAMGTPQISPQVEKMIGTEQVHRFATYPGLWQGACVDAISRSTSGQSRLR